MKVGYLDKRQILMTPSLSSNKIKNIAIELVFDQCDLNCPFCPNINLPRDNIKQRIDNCLHNFELVLQANKQNHLFINITGTELFQDRYDGDTFALICEAICRIKQLINQYHKTANYQITTHLIVKKIDRLASFLQNHKDIVINTSFDFQGRFQTKEQVDIFYKNVFLLKSLGFIVTIDTVAHKLNIDTIFKKSNPLVKLWYNLYQNFSCDFVIWQNTGNNIYQVPSTLMEQFVNYLWSEYPDTTLVRKLVSITQNQHVDFDCVDCIGIDSNIIKYRRCDNESKINNMTKCYNMLGCLYCEYNAYCGKQCWCELSKQDIKECWIKNVLKHNKK